MSEERKGINLFEVNGIQYTDNIPENMFIGITKEQYCEYLQLQQENQLLKRNCNIGNENLDFYRGEYKKIKPVLDEIREYINRFDFEFLHQCCEHNLVEALENLLQILDKVKE